MLGTSRLLAAFCYHPASVPSNEAHALSAAMSIIYCKVRAMAPIRGCQVLCSAHHHQHHMITNAQAVCAHVPTAQLSPDIGTGSVARVAPPKLAMASCTHKLLYLTVLQKRQGTAQTTVIAATNELLLHENFWNA
eukprot:4125669-Amphidinium_carterae.1